MLTSLDTLADNIKMHLANDTPVVYLALTDSTNNEAKRLIAKGLKGDTLIVAQRQSAGRGRQGKSFYSMCDSAIYMSAVFAVNDAQKDPASVTIAAAVAVAKSLEDITGLQPRIKWVNDIFYQGKKICGILSETTGGYTIVGIGINCDASHSDFPSELKSIAGGIPLNGASKEKLIADIYNKLCVYMSADFANLIEDYRARSFMSGKTVQYIKDGVSIKASVEDIDNCGRLIVLTEDGQKEALSSGEIVMIDNLYS